MYSKHLEKEDKRTNNRRTPSLFDKSDLKVRTDYVSDAIEAEESGANLVSSELQILDQFGGGARHAVAIDIDRPCLLIQSRTPGHYHLYIDTSIPWSKYLNLLEAMAQCQIIEHGYLSAAKTAKATFLRKDRWDLYAKIDAGLLEEIKQEVEEKDDQ
jgi:hypothetical protein